jgi:hypothetical protein
MGGFNNCWGLSIDSQKQIVYVSLNSNQQFSFQIYAVDLKTKTIVGTVGPLLPSDIGVNDMIYDRVRSLLVIQSLSLPPQFYVLNITDGMLNTVLLSTNLILINVAAWDEHAAVMRCEFQGSQPTTQFFDVDILTGNVTRSFAINNQVYYPQAFAYSSNTTQWWFDGRTGNPINTNVLSIIDVSKKRMTSQVVAPKFAPYLFWIGYRDK